MHLSDWRRRFRLAAARTAHVAQRCLHLVTCLLEQEQVRCAGLCQVAGVSMGGRTRPCHAPHTSTSTACHTTYPPHDRSAVRALHKRWQRSHGCGCLCTPLRRTTASTFALRFTLACGLAPALRSHAAWCTSTWGSGGVSEAGGVGASPGTRVATPRIGCDLGRLSLVRPSCGRCRGAGMRGSCPAGYRAIHGCIHRGIHWSFHGEALEIPPAPTYKSRCHAPLASHRTEGYHTRNRSATPALVVDQKPGEGLATVRPRPCCGSSPGVARCGFSVPARGPEYLRALQH